MRPSTTGYTLKELADFLDVDIRGDHQCYLTGLASLPTATADDLSFISNSKYQKHLDSTLAGAVILSPQDIEFFSGNALICDNPYLAYAKVSQLFAITKEEGGYVDPTATVHPQAEVSPSARLEAGVVIGARSCIGDNTVIGANTVIEQDSIVGAGTKLHPNVTLYTDVHLGENCLIHSGVVIGSDGFGFANDKGEWIKIAQLGGVRIGNNVEIGAGTTIDRGTLNNTVIEDGVIMDNLIQLAHNVKIGKYTAVAGCNAIAGSTEIGERCTIAGACGIAGHLKITDDTHITGMSMITKSITEPGLYSSGTGMMPNKKWQKNVVRFRQLDDMARRLKLLEDRIHDIKDS